MGLFPRRKKTPKPVDVRVTPTGGVSITGQTVDGDLSIVQVDRAVTINGEPHLGLQHRYDVTKRSTGERITDCFVLVPAKDPAARAALLAYAAATDNPALALDLQAWVASLPRTDS